MTSNQTNNIYPKPCAYGCSIQIYWNTSVNEYWEVFTKKKHSCPNHSNSITEIAIKANTTATTTKNKPTYYYNNNKKFVTKESKPKMSNSLELLSGPFSDIQNKQEILSDIVTEYNSKIHGSLSHVFTNNLISLIVYFEVPEGKRKEVKRKFSNVIVTILNK